MTLRRIPDSAWDPSSGRVIEFDPRQKRPWRITGFLDYPGIDPIVRKHVWITVVGTGRTCREAHRDFIAKARKEIRKWNIKTNPYQKRRPI